MDLPDWARHRVETYEIAWLTVVTGSGRPAPNPVWFVADSGTLSIWVQPESAKARNIAARPKVTVHLETTDPTGDDVLVFHGSATLEPGVPPMTYPGFAEKYSALMTQIELSAAEMDTYDTLVRFTPERARIGL